MHRSKHHQLFVTLSSYLDLESRGMRIEAQTLVLPLSGESCIASLRTWGSWHYDSLTSMGPATRNGEKATIALAEDATDSQLPVVLCFFSAH